ncbi:MULTISPECIES: DoxX family protein [Telluria group]|uniref:Putative oxidoreductase n=1 Tax=Pseudoduganella violacea TaxID=1715466 RepID=A0A7W5BBW6_9BURK|nr:MULTISPECIES: DoxX family protein [Telluria group]MBB3119475.1 putative oxidoreductase [Pseudoduganella violacea]UMR33117.1 DoxX family protein [Massilia sp. MB5]UTY55944.1 DoxX family protein [Massilia sp. erpn]
MNAILGLHRQLSRYDANLSDWGGSMLSLVLRFYVGSQFFKAGLLKVSDWGATLALFNDEYKVPLLPPDLAAYLGAGGELLLPVLLFAGLMMRPAALALLAVNILAVLSYPQLFGFECPAALNDHFYWGVLLVVLAVFGPGRFSIDSILARQKP